MRLFTALDLPDEVVASLEDLLLGLRPKAAVNWSPPANLHITTKFIGEWPDARLEELRVALDGLPARAPIAVTVASLGYYPNARSPRVLWCGVKGEGLEELAGATDRATAPLGIVSEKRAYSPHLTLARIKDPHNLRALQTAVLAQQARTFGSFEARSFFLYRSQLRPTGSVYTKLAEFPFRTR